MEAGNKWHPHGALCSFPCHVNVESIGDYCTQLGQGSGWVHLEYYLEDEGHDTTRAADPEEAEAISVIRGMEAAHGLGLDRVLLLTDCQRLVRAFHECSDELSWGALTLAAHMRALASKFLDFQFEYVERSLNFVAHSLAARGACSPPFVCSEPDEVSLFVNSLCSCLRA
ncbi:hypothetical protein GIB67_005280 [Kingdonia uniflora]|uniref:RNase H type-1 domain-containing protein n=1 Tax=Kingdonia uniflora TaxID=39325 RepID=A0A7J7N0Z3_9MAGN|nr:hypothetical protein GIB67_005280 [Kingdonia uniflora]